MTKNIHKYIISAILFILAAVLVAGIGNFRAVSADAAVDLYIYSDEEITCADEFYVNDGERQTAFAYGVTLSPYYSELAENEGGVTIQPDDWYVYHGIGYAVVVTDSLTDYTLSSQDGADITSLLSDKTAGLILPNLKRSCPIYSFFQTPVKDRTDHYLIEIFIDENDQNADRYYFIVQLGFDLAVKGENEGQFGFEEVREKYISTGVVSQYICCNLSELAMKKLYANGDNLDEQTRNYYKTIAGVTVPNTINVKVNYKVLGDDKIITSRFFTQTGISEANAFSKDRIVEAIYNSHADINSVDYFNVVKSEGYYLDGAYQETANSIVMQARGYDYIYDNARGAGELTVLYDDFRASEFYMQIRSNIDSRLTFNVYTSSLVSTSTGKRLIFDVTRIAENLSNLTLGGTTTQQWIFDKEEGLSVSSNGYQNSGINWSVVSEAGGQKIYVDFTTSAEKDLCNLYLYGSAKVIPNEPYATTVVYKTITENGGGYSVTEETFSAGDVLLTDIRHCEAFVTNFATYIPAAYEKIREGIEVSALDGAKPLTAVSVEGSESYEDKTCILRIVYDTKPIFCVWSGTVGYKYMDIDENKTTLFGTDFTAVITIPLNHYVSKMSSPSGYVRITNDAQNYKNTAITFTRSISSIPQNTVIRINVEFSDKHNVVFKYLKTYKETPFATLEEFSGQLSYSLVSDVGRLKGKGGEDMLAEGTGLTLNALSSRAVVKDISFDNNTNTYNITLEYSFASIRQIDYNGSSQELKVPLTSFSDWKAANGLDWSIAMLNTEKSKWFEFTNEVEDDELYGYFSQAIFEEKVSDLNYWFRGNTGDGAMTIFESKQVSGSGIYQTFARLQHSLFGIPATVGMIFCELLNSENKTYHTYYFYLDGTNMTDPFLSNGKADNAYDTDSAVKNTAQDVGDKIGAWASGVGEWYTNNSSKIWYVIWCVVGLIGYIVATWALNKFGLLKYKIILIVWIVISVALAVLASVRGIVVFTK